VGLYEGALAELIRLLKFEGERALALELARLMLPRMGEFKVDAITFVPLHPLSERARGFNQAELLAMHLGELADIPVLPTLMKIRETRPQVELTGPERIKNVEGAFAPLGAAQGKRVLLIDDVYTTGATVRECSRALKEAGYEWVGILTPARTPRSPLPPDSATEAEDAG
jgi:ComF family protein